MQTAPHETGSACDGGPMCRSIHVLDNVEPPATSDEVRAAALQYVRKVSGKTKPSAVNQEAFDDAVEAVTAATQRLLDHLVTKAPPRNREIEAAKARARWISGGGRYDARSISRS
jgi:hypothetical protein